MTCFYDSFQIVFYILGFSYFVELESSKTELMVFYNLMTEMLPHHFHIQREGKGKTCNCWELIWKATYLEFNTDIGKLLTYLEEEFLKFWFGATEGKTFNQILGKSERLERKNLN